MAKLKINRGTTYTRSGTYSKNGVLQDLSNSIIRFTMKTEESDQDFDDVPSAVVKKDITDGNTEGEYNIVLDPADTAQLEPGEYFYDIKVDVASDGVTVYKLDEGTIELDGSPTNRLS